MEQILIGWHPIPRIRVPHRLFVGAPAHPVRVRHREVGVIPAVTHQRDFPNYHVGQFSFSVRIPVRLILRILHFVLMLCGVGTWP